MLVWIENIELFCHVGRVDSYCHGILKVTCTVALSFDAPVNPHILGANVGFSETYATVT